jgi:hypothetical protein
MNVKSPNNTSKWQMGFNSAFKGLRMGGVVPPLNPRAFVALTETSSTFIFTFTFATPAYCTKSEVISMRAV